MIFEFLKAHGTLASIVSDSTCKRRLLRLIAPILGASLLAGCALLAPRVAVESATFERPEEILKGTGRAAKYWVLADRRTFAVMAFLNAVGYDEEVPNAQMTSLRLKVRERVATRLAGHLI